MQLKLSWIIVLVFISNLSFAQIIGDTTVCSGNIYSYSATIPGAATYTWTFPSGWYGITGQGSSNATASCNINAGNICVEGFDGLNNSVGAICLTTQFGGGGGAGWDVTAPATLVCANQPFALNIVPNGSGGGSCPAGCGNGTAITNLGYAVYDDIWPNGNFMGFADGSPSLIISTPGIQLNLYVYYVDYTTGTATTQAVPIQGGCGSGIVNNVIQMSVPISNGVFTQTPASACIGDTVVINEIYNASGLYYNPVGITIVSQSVTTLTAVINSPVATVDYDGISWSGCTYSGQYNIDASCTPTIISGDTTVCSGIIYSYSATIPGANYYTWTFPSGWYDVYGQGTSNVSVTCNVNVGNICVEGFDGLNNSLGTICLTTQFGGGGAAGWDVAPSAYSSCINNPVGFIPAINSNGTGGGSCPAGCGSGVQHPNIVYAVYNNVWPNGSFIQYVDGFSIIAPPPFNTTYYVYLVDVTYGQNPNQAILISGGCGGGVVNNTISLFLIWPNLPVISSSPNPVCVGDTVTVNDNSALINPWWNVSTGGILLNNNLSSIDVIVTGIPCQVYIEGTDMNTLCFTNTNFSVPVINCLPTSISGDSIICAGYTYNYSATISGAVTYQWTFPSGWYDITGQGTSNASATCNVSDGNVCVEGFDALNNSVGIVCILTQFGDGGSAGWMAYPPTNTSCQTQPFAITIVPNGTSGGGCPTGCGNGFNHPNLVYAIYDNVWPLGNFIGFADGSPNAGPVIPGFYTYNVYYVDITNGTSASQAVLISGSCAGGTVNNSFQVGLTPPSYPGFNQTPMNVCVGDTVELNEITGTTNGLYYAPLGITILSQNQNYMTAVVNSLLAHVEYSGTDIYNCPVSGTGYISTISCNNSLAGDTVVCSGYTYNYSATIPGAVSYQWLFPTGWYDITGQTTSNVSATCNINDGWISVSGYDASGNIIGAEQILTQFSPGSGWEVSPAIAQGCYSDHFTVSVNPNGTGGGPGCPSGCGNGVQHPNIVFGIFSDVWGMPGCQYIGEINVSQIAFITGTLYIYQVDISNGTGMGQPILIEGGCGNAVVNNEVYVSVIFINPVFSQSPATVCIGDTVTLTCTNGPWSYYQWGAVSNCNVIYQNYDTAIYVVTGLNANADLQEGCGYGQYNINVSACAIPSVQFASSDTVFCDKQSIDFFDFSTNNPTTWQWTFTGASPNNSTDQNPTGIYYPANGTFDVELIACNANGCDTLLMQNFITEFQAPSIPVITGNSGTMYCSGYNTYQWFLTGSGTVLSTDSFYVPTQQGSYFLIATDTNGCEIASNVFVITDLTPNPTPKERGVSIVPNPNDGNFEIQFNSEQGTTNFELRIFNSVGQDVFHSLLTTHYSSLNTQLENGIYFIEIKKGENIWREKFVINK